MCEEGRASALGQLREARAARSDSPQLREIIEARDAVLARYGPLFQPNAIANLDEEEFRSFFYFENNRHWTGLYRQVNRVCSDMSATRSALAVLVDESRPIQDRLNEVVAAVHGMGKGIVTAILHVAYPDRYGVWNTTSEAGMIALGLMPDLPRGASFGDRYAAMNDEFVRLKDELDVDLWTLDALWWSLRTDDDGAPDTEVATGYSDVDTNDVRFGLERHLHDFLFDNWDATTLGREWAIFERPGEPDAGYEFPTQVGRIDLLAKHRSEPRWLVIELKRDRTTDRVVGQTLRYVGWVSQHVAQADEKVEGLIIGQHGDDRLQYALKAAPNVSFLAYRVEFQLVSGAGADDGAM